MDDISKFAESCAHVIRIISAIVLVISLVVAIISYISSEKNKNKALDLERESQKLKDAVSSLYQWRKR